MTSLRAAALRRIPCLWPRTARRAGPRRTPCVSAAALRCTCTAQPQAGRTHERIATGGGGGGAFGRRLRRWNPPQLKPQLKHTASPRAPPGTSRTRKSAMAEAVHLFETAVRHNIKACHSACHSDAWGGAAACMSSFADCRLQVLMFVKASQRRTFALTVAARLSAQSAVPPPCPCAARRCSLARSDCAVLC